MTKKSPVRRARQRKATEALQAAFPLAFPVDEADIRPLAIGIRDDLIAWYATQKLNITLNYIIGALRHHCWRTAYRQKLIAGAMRINLKGEPVSPVTEEAAALAVEQIKEAETARLNRPDEQTRKLLRRQAAQAKRQAEAAAKQAEAAAKKAAKVAASKPASEPKPKQKPKPATKPQPAPAAALTKPAVAKPAATVIVKKKRTIVIPPA
ncbi:ProQ/FinO family protein [Chromatium okenii]|nr:ProQ/FinO family protein [Chromatium okenii]